MTTACVFMVWIRYTTWRSSSSRSKEGRRCGRSRDRPFQLAGDAVDDLVFLGALAVSTRRWPGGHRRDRTDATWITADVSTHRWPEGHRRTAGTRTDFNSPQRTLRPLENTPGGRTQRRRFNSPAPEGAPKDPWLPSRPPLCFNSPPSRRTEEERARLGTDRRSVSTHRRSTVVVMATLFQLTVATRSGCSLVRPGFNSPTPDVGRPCVVDQLSACVSTRRPRGVRLGA